MRSILRSRRTRGGLAAVALVAGAALTRAHACSCLPPPPPREALLSSPAVFLGVVRDVDGSYPVPAGDDTYLESGRSFRMEVIVGWKGQDRREVVVLTGSGAGECGFDFVVGEAYLVYADRRPGADTVTASLCSRTRALAGATADSTALGKPAIDLSGGRPWRSFRPGERCPVHRDGGIRVLPTSVVFGLSADLDPEYRRARASRFPYAGLQIDRPPPATHDEAGRLFRGLNRALVCPVCRSQAREWCRRHGAHVAVDGE